MTGPRATTASKRARLPPDGAGLRRPWREHLRELRAAMRDAERQRGRDREQTLVRACRAFTQIAPPPRETRAFDRAAWAIEVKLGRMVNDCVGCFAMRSVPEDRPGRRSKRGDETPTCREDNREAARDHHRRARAPRRARSD